MKCSKISSRISQSDINWQLLAYAGVLGGFGLRSLIILWSNPNPLQNLFTTVHPIVVVFCIFSVVYLMRGTR